MVFIVGRIGVLIFTFTVGLPIASALDFEREIAKQQKTVKVRYKRAPKSMSHFMNQYRHCRPHYGVARTRCNVAEAKRQYKAYKVAWEQKQRRQVAMSTGEFQVSLERKE